MKKPIIAFLIVFSSLFITQTYAKKTYGLSWSAFAYEMNSKSFLAPMKCNACLNSCIGVVHNQMEAANKNFNCEQAKCLLQCESDCPITFFKGLGTTFTAARKMSNNCDTDAETPPAPFGKSEQSSAANIPNVGSIPLVFMLLVEILM